MSERPMPLWLVAAADQRLAQFADQYNRWPKQVQEAARNRIIMTTLTEPPEDADEQMFHDWDHQCDHCKEVDPDGFETRHISLELDRGMKFTITIGACAKCWALP